MTYERMKRLITEKKYSKAEALEMLDVFLFAQRITTEEYTELTTSVKEKLV